MQTTGKQQADRERQTLPSRAMLILGTVIAVELLTLLLHGLLGGSITAVTLAGSAVRVILIGLVTYLLLARDEPEAPAAQSVKSAPSPQAAQPEVEVWPNIDTLTRTANQRGLTITILELMALAQRYGHQLAVGLLQTHGLEQLDEEQARDALVEIAGLLSESVRMPDKVGRYDDEHFMVVLPETDIEGARVVATRLHQAVASHGESGLRVTIGMTVFRNGDDLHGLLSRAHAAVDEARASDDGIACVA